MMIQTWALLVDAYRQLCARKLFWVTLLLGVLVVLAFASVGINDQGLTLLVWQLPSQVGQVTLTRQTMPPDVLYRTMFATLAVPIWLSWVAVVLGLVATAGIIPDMIQGGTIESMLSRPIGRVRLLLTRFVGGLLFVALQVLVFCLLVFLVIALRGRSLAPEVFLAVPVVVLMYSYLYAVCVLLGLLTRSTIAALLLTLLFWMLVFLVNTADGIVVTIHEQARAELDQQRSRVERMERNAAEVLLREANDLRAAEGLEPLDALDPSPEPQALDARDVRLPAARGRVASLERDDRLAGLWRRGIYAAKTLLPKTQETIGLLERWTIDRQALNRLAPTPQDEQERTRLQAQQAVQQAFASRPLWWVLGTSLAFEAVVLALASWIFARRDF
ncbi:MAG: hypothetical protein KatS3mg103_0421 [Phycisphaerales bacterium]|nr:MAG: hypothetical protein KatS3mg103_0421 [Phycisphaerales bacterium]